jgi:hypothetical protein
MAETTTSRQLRLIDNGALPSEVELPLDTEEADRAADEALALKLGTTTRSEIDNFTLQLSGQIALFIEAVREGGGVEARVLCLEADHLTASAPAEGLLVFNAWNYVRDLARVLRKLVEEHSKQVAESSPALPVRTPRASLGDLPASRQTFLVPSGPAPDRKPMPGASER